MKTDDLPSKTFSQIAHRLHPKIGLLYDGHVRFFNDGFVELLCLLIADVFVIVFSFYFVGLILALVLTCVSTPVTYCLKYLLHKHWVWK